MTGRRGKLLEFARHTFGRWILVGKLDISSSHSVSQQPGALQ